jgi:hypothetical protein
MFPCPGSLYGPQNGSVRDRARGGGPVRRPGLAGHGRLRCLTGDSRACPQNLQNQQNRPAGEVVWVVWVLWRGARG